VRMMTIFHLHNNNNNNNHNNNSQRNEQNSVCVPLVVRHKFCSVSRFRCYQKSLDPCDEKIVWLKWETSSFWKQRVCVCCFCFCFVQRDMKNWKQRERERERKFPLCVWTLERVCDCWLWCLLVDVWRGGRRFASSSLCCVLIFVVCTSTTSSVDFSCWFYSTTTTSA
jgi:hypothetical protein